MVEDRDREPGLAECKAIDGAEDPSHQNKAIRLWLNPMLPRLAKPTRTRARRGTPNRIRTWVDRSTLRQLRPMLHEFYVYICLTFCERSRLRRSYRCTSARTRVAACGTVGTPVRVDGRADALGLDKRAEDRQRQVGMTGLDRLIQPVRQFALA